MLQTIELPCCLSLLSNCESKIEDRAGLNTLLLSPPSLAIFNYYLGLPRLGFSYIGSGNWRWQLLPPQWIFSNVGVKVSVLVQVKRWMSFNRSNYFDIIIELLFYNAYSLWNIAIVCDYHCGIEFVHSGVIQHVNSEIHIWPIFFSMNYFESLGTIARTSQWCSFSGCLKRPKISQLRGNLTLWLVDRHLGAVVWTDHWEVIELEPWSI